MSYDRMKWLRACIWPAGGSLKTPDLGYTYAVLVTFNFPNLLNTVFPSLEYT